MWLRQRRGKGTGRSARRQPRAKIARRRQFQARIEALESRHMLASSITVVPGTVGTGDQDFNLLADGQILFGDADIGGNTLSTGALSAVTAATLIVVESTGTITFNDLLGTLTLQTEAGNSATFATNTAGGGAITFANAANTLATSGGVLIFDAGAGLTLANLDVGVGDVFAEAGDISAGNLSLAAITARDVGLSSMGGAILDANDPPAGTLNITAVNLRMRATTGIGTGAASALETQVSSLGAVTDTGGVFVSNGVTAAVDLNIGLVSAVFGDIELVNAGSIILDGDSTDNIFTGAGNVLVQAHGSTANVEVRNDGLFDTDDGNMTVLAGQDILLGSPAEDDRGRITANGNVLLTAGRDIVLDESSQVDTFGATSPEGAVTAIAGRNIAILESDGTDGARIITLDKPIVLTTGAGGTFTGDGGVTVLDTTLGGTGSGANITINADDISLANAINAGTGIVTLQQASAARPLDLGTNTMGTLGLTDAELDLVTASLLRLGRPDSTGLNGFIRLTATITGAASYNSTLSLRSGAAGIVDDNSNGSLQITNLAAQTAGVFVFNGFLHQVANVAGAAHGIAAFAFVFTNVTDLTVGGPIDGFTGIETTGGGVLLTSGMTAGTTLTVSDALMANGNIHLSFDDIALNAAVQTSGLNRRVTLVPTSPAQVINLGTNAAGQLGLTDAELDQVTATGVLGIGSASNTGGISTTNTMSQAGSGYTTLSLHTDGAVVDGTATEQPDITVTNLALVAGNGIGAADPLDLAVTNVALDNTAGAVQIFNNGPLTIGTVDGLSGATSAGTIFIAAAGSLIVAADVTATEGLLWAKDSAATGNDLTLNPGVTAEATTGGLTFEAGDTLNLLAGSTVKATTLLALVDFGSLDVGAGGTANINGMLEAFSMTVAGGSDSDTFSITPDDNTSITVTGGNPTPPVSPGDALGVNLADTTGATLTATSTPTGFEGGWTFTNRASVEFIQIESLLPPIRITDVSALEGNGGPTPFVFNVILDAASTTEVTVVVGTDDGTAITTGVSASGGNDYQSTTTTLTFAPGQTSQQVTVLVNGDATFEANETFFVNLSAAVNAVVVDAQAQATIANDDAQPTLSINDRTVSENVGNAVFTVTLSSPSDQTVTVAFATADNSAMAGSDYQSTSGSLTFMPGETTKSVTVPVVNDSLDEPDERFVVNLLGAISAVASDPQGVGTILANDSSPFAVGADAGGGPHVRVFTGATADEKFSFFAYNPAFMGGVRVAMGDVTRDGTPDIITGAGPGGGPHVRVFDGVTGAQVPGPIGSFFAYNITFGGGVFVASADFNHDGFADVLTGAGAGGGPHVRVFSGMDGSELASFFDPPKGGDGVRVASGDINGDGTPDIITAPGSGVVLATVRVFNGLTNQPIAGPLGAITPYPGFEGGVYIAAGDVNGDGRDDVITGAGAGGGPHVKAFSGLTGAEIASFFAYSPTFAGGVRVGVGDVNQDGVFDIITGAGPGGGPHVKAFNGAGGAEITSFLAFNPAFTGGVFVGGAAAAAITVISPPEQPHFALLGLQAPARSVGTDLFFSASEENNWAWLEEDTTLEPIDLTSAGVKWATLSDHVMC